MFSFIYFQIKTSLPSICKWTVVFYTIHDNLVSICVDVPSRNQHLWKNQQFTTDFYSIFSDISAYLYIY